MKTMNVRTAIAVAAGIAVIAVFFWFGMPESGQSPETIIRSATGDTADLSEQFRIPLSDDVFTEVTPGLKVAIIVEGDGDSFVAGEMIAVHYVGKLSDGKQFDSSLERGEPLVFEFGARQLIPGFEIGVEGMRVGSVRRLMIAPELGYGETGVTLPDGTVVIPSNETLIFDVSLVGINRK